MKYLLRIYPLCLMAVLYLLLTSQYNNPENGKTGAPGEGDCADCHTPNTAIDGNISLSGIPDVLYAGNTYTVTLRVNKTVGNPVNAGIQMTVVDEDNNRVGTLSNPTGISGIVPDMNGKTYFEHKGGPTNFYDSTFAQWTVDWTAPDSIDAEKTVSFYAGAVLSNGDSTVQGDRPVKTVFNSPLQQGVTGLTVSSSQQDVLCFGESSGRIDLSIIGGNLPYSILWSTGDSTASVSQLQAGSYSVTVSDANLDTFTQDFIIQEPTPVIIELVSKTQINCSGQNNGTAEVRTSGGKGPITVRWPDGDTSHMRNNLTARTYQVIATDANGCSDTLNITIEATINLQPNTQKIDESFPGANDGIAYIAPTGGTPPYLVLWSKDNITSDTISNLSPGKYVVLLSDISGCLISDTVEILKGTCKLNGQISLINNECFGDENGSISVTIDSAQGTTSFLWSTGDTTASIHNLAAGSYGVTATDTIGCVFTDTIQITEPDELQVIPYSTSNSTCSSASDGSIIIQINGGVAPYSIDWSHGSSSDTLRELTAGIYAAIVTDSLNCIDSLSIEITEEDRLPPQLIRTSFNLNLDAAGIAQFPNDSLISLIVDNCDIDSVYLEKNSFDCSQLGENRVQLTAQDGSGNVLIDTLTIIVIDNLGPVFTPKENIFSRFCSGFVYNLPTATDNCGLDTIRLIEGIGPEGIFPLGNTSEKYLAIDEFGNSSTYSFLVNIDPDVEFSPVYQLPSCPGNTDGNIQLTPSVDTIVFSYIWANGSTGKQLDSISAGVYPVLISDTLGCQYNDTFMLSDPLFHITIDSTSQPGEDTNGFISIQISGGVAPYDIEWSKDGEVILQDVFDAGGLAAGEYIVRVEDDEGCVVTSDTITLEKTSNLYDPILDEVKVFPNPARSRLNIELPAAVVLEKAAIYTFTGFRIFQMEANDLDNIILPSLPTGMYIIKLDTDQGEVMRKLVIYSE